MSDYLKTNREHNLRAVIDQVELSARRTEAWAIKRPNHIDLLPDVNFKDPNTGRRQLEPDPRLVFVGRYLRRARRYAGKSQQRVANESGVTQSQVSRAERGLAPAMGLIRLVMMSETLGRLFPLGTCPHDHECAWQPIRPPEHRTTAVERLLTLLAEPDGERTAPAEGDPMESVVSLDD